MSTHYETPQEMRELEKIIDDFTYQNGLNIDETFRDFLRYVVNGFSLPGTPPLTDWKYKKEQTLVFHQMFTTWVQIMDKQIRLHGWYDALGELYMALVSKGTQKKNSQFFSPKEIPELMRQIVNATDTKIDTIFDLAAGSGRLLIANKTPKSRNFLVAWDINYTCCLMCVCNFLMNSCVGEVVCIDSLKMDNFRGAWLINEAYYRTGLPSVRSMNEQEYSIYKKMDIPAYVYFLDQEKYDGYFRMRQLWENISVFFNTEHKP